MALSIASFSSALETEIKTKVAGGSSLSVFTNAVATGVINTTIGLTGQITTPAGVGTSSGTGITGLTGSSISGDIVSTGSSLFGQAGVSLADMGDAIGAVVVAQFSANVDLTSNANGDCTFASFLVAITSMTSAIQAAAGGFSGPQWGNFATAIATGICNDIGNNGVGSLSGAGGGGPGSGVVTIA